MISKCLKIYLLIFMMIVQPSVFAGGITSAGGTHTDVSMISQRVLNPSEYLSTASALQIAGFAGARAQGDIRAVSLKTNYSADAYLFDDAFAHTNFEDFYDNRRKCIKMDDGNSVSVRGLRGWQQFANDTCRVTGTNKPVNFCSCIEKKAPKYRQSAKEKKDLEDQMFASMMGSKIADSLLTMLSKSERIGYGLITNPEVVKGGESLKKSLACLPGGVKGFVDNLMSKAKCKGLFENEKFVKAFNKQLDKKGLKLAKFDDMAQHISDNFENTIASIDERHKWKFKNNVSHLLGKKVESKDVYPLITKDSPVMKVIGLHQSYLNSDTPLEKTLDNVAMLDLAKNHHKFYDEKSQAEMLPLYEAFSRAYSFNPILRQTLSTNKYNKEVKVIASLSNIDPSEVIHQSSPYQYDVLTNNRAEITTSPIVRLSARKLKGEISQLSHLRDYGVSTNYSNLVASNSMYFTDLAAKSDTTIAAKFLKEQYGETPKQNGIPGVDPVVTQQLKHEAMREISVDFFELLKERVGEDVLYKLNADQLAKAIQIIEKEEIDAEIDSCERAANNIQLMCEMEQSQFIAGTYSDSYKTIDAVDEIFVNENDSYDEYKKKHIQVAAVACENKKPKKKRTRPGVHRPMPTSRQKQSRRNVGNRRDRASFSTPAKESMTTVESNTDSVDTVDSAENSTQTLTSLDGREVTVTQHVADDGSLVTTYTNSDVFNTDEASVDRQTRRRRPRTNIAEQLRSSISSNSDSTSNLEEMVVAIEGTTETQTSDSIMVIDPAESVDVTVTVDESDTVNTSESVDTSETVDVTDSVDAIDVVNSADTMNGQEVVSSDETEFVDDPAGLNFSDGIAPWGNAPYGSDAYDTYSGSYTDSQTYSSPQTIRGVNQGAYQGSTSSFTSSDQAYQAMINNQQSRIAQLNEELEEVKKEKDADDIEELESLIAETKQKVAQLKQKRQELEKRVRQPNKKKNQAVAQETVADGSTAVIASDDSSKKVKTEEKPVKMAPVIVDNSLSTVFPSGSGTTSSQNKSRSVVSTSRGPKTVISAVGARGDLSNISRDDNAALLRLFRRTDKSKTSIVIQKNSPQQISEHIKKQSQELGVASPFIATIQGQTYKITPKVDSEGHVVMDDGVVIYDQVPLEEPGQEMAKADKDSGRSPASIPRDDSDEEKSKVDTQQFDYDTMKKLINGDIP
jgi:seryl-tRNA synthetase